MESALNLTDAIAPQLVRILRDAIAQMRLQPGSALSEKDIAARYGVSRQPVREAFIKLSEAGLVEIRPSRGTYVTKISVRDVANARFVREALEADMVRNAAQLARPEHIAVLHGLIDRQRRAAGLGDFATFNHWDEEFHKAIAGIVGNDFAWRIVEAARIQTDRVRLLSLPDASPLELLIGQHADIVARLDAGDADGAAHSMRRHLHEILRALSHIAPAHPELFSDTELPAHTLHLVPQD